jgi:hypothetical protein
MSYEDEVHYNPGVKVSAPEGSAVSAPLVTPDLLLLLQMNVEKLL